MREVKFRAMVKGDAGMYEVEAINWLDQVIYLDGARHGEKTPFKKIRALMQYIGMDDYKGQAICEGDVAHTLYYDEDAPIGVVKYLDGSFELIDSKGGDHDGCCYYPECRDPNEWVVLGNIYQNPDLLAPPSRGEAAQPLASQQTPE